MMMQVTCTTVIIYKGEPQNGDTMTIVFLMKKVHLIYWHIPSFFLFSFFFLIAKFSFKICTREREVYMRYISILSGLT